MLNDTKQLYVGINQCFIHFLYKVVSVLGVAAMNFKKKI